MKTKIKTKAKSKDKIKNRSYFELVGNIYIVEEKGTKEVSREEIDGKVVLKLLLHALTESLDRMELDNE